MMKFLALTLAVLTFAFALPTEIGKRTTERPCIVGGITFPHLKLFTLHDESNCTYNYCKDGSPSVLYKGCYYDGACHELDSIWTNIYCITYQCRMENNSPIRHPLSAECQDVHGVCRNSSEWSTFIWGKIRYANCSCSIEVKGGISGTRFIDCSPW